MSGWPCVGVCINLSILHCCSPWRNSRLHSSLSMPIHSRDQFKPPIEVSLPATLYFCTHHTHLYIACVHHTSRWPDTSLSTKSTFFWYWTVSLHVWVCGSILGAHSCAVDTLYIYGMPERMCMHTRSHIDVPFGPMGLSTDLPRPLYVPNLWVT